MNISNEVILNVYRNYLGCQVQTNVRQSQGEGLPFKKLKGTLMDIDLFGGIMYGILLENESDKSNYKYLEPIREFKPILRPLSAITDEEAIEVARLIGFPGRHVLENGRAFIKNVFTDKTSVPFNFHPQYLISIGIDLPNFHLGGKTLKECDMCVYEGEEK